MTYNTDRAYLEAFARLNPGYIPANLETARRALQWRETGSSAGWKEREPPVFDVISEICPKCKSAVVAPCLGFKALEGHCCAHCGACQMPIQVGVPHRCSDGTVKPCPITAGWREMFHGMIPPGYLDMGAPALEWTTWDETKPLPSRGDRLHIKLKGSESIYRAVHLGTPGGMAWSTPEETLAVEGPDHEPGWRFVQVSDVLAFAPG